MALISCYMSASEPLESVELRPHASCPPHSIPRLLSNSAIWTPWPLCGCSSGSCWQSRCLADNDACARERDGNKNNTVFYKTLSGRTVNYPTLLSGREDFMEYCRRENFEVYNNAIIYSNPVITKLLKYCLEVYNNAYRFLNMTFSRWSPP